MSEQGSAPVLQWACAPDRTEIYQMGLVSREAALRALEGEAGEIVCYERGAPAKSLESIFDVSLLFNRAEEALSGGEVIADFEGGFFDSEPDESVLRKRLAEAFVGWMNEVNPSVWTIVERTIVEPEEADEDAQNTAS